MDDDFKELALEMTTGCLSACGQSIQKMVDALSGTHMVTWPLVGTRTGRLTSTTPNVMELPRA